MDAIKILVVIILFIGAMSVIAEAVFVAIAFFTADRIECNLLWCSFITERGTEEVIQSRDCFMNGVRINCTEIKGQIGKSSVNYIAVGNYD